MDQSVADSLSLSGIVGEETLSSLERGSLLVSPPATTSISLPGASSANGSDDGSLSLLPLPSLPLPNTNSLPVLQTNDMKTEVPGQLASSVARNPITLTTLSQPSIILPPSTSSGVNSSSPALVAQTGNSKSLPAGVPPIPAGMQSIQIPSLQGLSGIPISSRDNKTSIESSGSSTSNSTSLENSSNSSAGSKKMNFSPVFLLQRMRIPVQGNAPLQLPTVNKMSGVQYTWASPSGLPAPFLVIPRNDAKPGIVKSESNGETKSGRRGKGQNVNMKMNSDVQNLRYV
mmetsp:Transcript_15033/g.22731  ORF Transcript_15033/g.22731 Transcript_15033/m.22731 type:complete len:287 (+) Transcript_15033:166-1026(+)